MGSARRVLETSPFQDLAESNRMKQSLEEDVMRTRKRLSTGKKDGMKSQEYVKALIRFNEFLLQEKAKLLVK
jgi:hypothetical protein